MTIREMIEDLRVECLDSSVLTPARASEILVELTALFSNVNEEIRKRDMEYNKILLKTYEEETKANRAKIKAETSPEYEAKRIAKDTKEVLNELIGSLKYYLRSQEQEFKRY